MMSQQAIANDPRANLSAYVSLAPSKEALMQLSGQVAAYMQEQSDPAIAATYMSAGEDAVSNLSLSSCIQCCRVRSCDLFSLCFTHMSTSFLLVLVARHMGMAMPMNDLAQQRIEVLEVCVPVSLCLCLL
jgi:hypothetical protein